MEHIPDYYFYSIIPYIIVSIVLIVAAIQEKDIDAWQYAGVVFIIGIMPFNLIVLMVISVFLGGALVVASLGGLSNWVFNKLTK